MYKVFFALLIFVAHLAPALSNDPKPTEDDFLRACYKICDEFTQEPGHLDEVAELNLSPSALEIYRQAVDLKMQIEKLGQYDKELVKAALITSSRAWMSGNLSEFPAPGLSALQTAAIQQYSGEDYKRVNPALRSRYPVDREFFIYRDFINTALSILPKYDGPVHRGIKAFEGWDEIFLEGSVYIEKAFMSTSSDFSDFKFASDICILIHSHNGRDISAISRTGKEKEVLYPAGSTFKVKAVNPNWNQPRGRILIELEEIEKESMSNAL